MSSHHTSAKGNSHPRRMHLICPAPGCGKRFSLNYSEYRKYVRAGRRPTCSRECGWAYRKTMGSVPE